jgi:hypothetical protein
VSWDTGRNEHVAPRSPSAASSRTRSRSTTCHRRGRRAHRLRGPPHDSNFGSESLGGELHGGLEYWFHNALAARAGVDGRDLTFGAGLRNKSLGIDFAAMFNRFFETDGVTFAGDEDQGVGYRISGSYDW